MSDWCRIASRRGPAGFGAFLGMLREMPSGISEKMKEQ